MTSRGFLGRFGFREYQPPPPPPQMLSATATSPQTIHVNYNQNMADDVLDPDNYTLTSTEGHIPNITGIIFQPPGQKISIEITLDSELTNEAEYRITANNVHSELGILIDPLYNFADFLGQGEPPYLVGAVAADERHIEVLFSEPMSTVGLDDADSYEFSPNTFNIKDPVDITYNPLVVLELNVGEMRQGQTYTLTVSDTLRDVANNLIDPERRTADFLGKGILPRVVEANFFIIGEQHRIRVEFNESMDTTTTRNRNNYTIQAVDPDSNPAPQILNVAEISPYVVEVITSKFSAYGAYKIIGSSGIKDFVGNPLDPEHNSAEFFVPVTPPVIEIYPTPDTMTFSSMDPVRVTIYDVGEAEHFGLNPASINIRFQNNLYAVAAGELNTSLFNISMSGDYDTEEGVTYEIIYKPEWLDFFYTIRVEAADIASHKNGVISSFVVRPAGCWENKKSLSDLEAKFYLPLTNKVYETLRTTLLNNVTTSRVEFANAKTILYLASISDALALISEYIGSVYVNGKFCFRRPILEVDKSIRGIIPQLIMAVRLERSMSQELRDKFISFLESESPVYRVNGAAALLVYVVANS